MMYVIFLVLHKFYKAKFLYFGTISFYYSLCKHDHLRTPMGLAKTYESLIAVSEQIKKIVMVRVGSITIDICYISDIGIQFLYEILLILLACNLLNVLILGYTKEVKE